jgi:hypothetical protein
MHRITGALLCAAALVAATSVAWARGLEPAKPEDVGLSSERLGRIKEVFGREIEQGRLPGAVVLVARKGGSPTTRPSASWTRPPASRCRRTRCSGSTR